MSVRRASPPKQEGQVYLALLLVVLVLFFLALAFGQVGSAAEQKTQTQSATDSAAVSAGHELREGSISTANVLFAGEHSFGPLFAALPVYASDPAAAACTAATRSWSDNSDSHHGGLGCGDLTVAAAANRVTVTVDAPAGEIAAGPVDLTAAREQARATAQVVRVACPVIVGPAKAAADAIADHVIDVLGVAGLPCSTAADRSTLAQLDRFPTLAPSLGPPNLILRAVSSGFTVEIVS